MSARFRREDVGDGIMLLTIDRADALNAIDTATGEEMLQLFSRDLRRMEGLRCVVVTGAGDRAFCVGADLKERKDFSEAAFRGQHVTFRQAFEAVWNFPLPILAAVKGYALGGGCELALACDFIYAAEGAEFALPEIRLGIMPGGGGTQLLPRAIPERRARELLYTGRRFSARQALEWGMVNRVLSAEDLLTATLDAAREIVLSGPLSVAGAKRAVTHGLQAGLATGLALEVSIHQRLVASADRVEGIAAFNEKRPPVWRND